MSQIDPAQYTLVQLKTKQEFTQEGELQQNALGHMFEYLTERNIRVFSVRTADDKPLLSLAVQPGGFADHIVGFQNRPPSEAEVELVTQMLKPRGIQNIFDGLKDANPSEASDA